MAKKNPSRAGGRVTPKGTRPVERTKGRSPDTRPDLEPPPVTRSDPANKGRSGGGPQGPTRSGHHRGQR